MILSKLTVTEAENNKKMIGSKKYIKLFTHDIFEMNKKKKIYQQQYTLNNNDPLCEDTLSAQKRK